MRNRAVKPVAGPELDRELERRILGRQGAAEPPPFSTMDWTAIVLAEMVVNRTGWRYQLIRHDGVWSALWVEGEPVSRERLAAMITSNASTRALAVCRGLLAVTQSPGWSEGSLRSRRAGSARAEEELVAAASD